MPTQRAIALKRLRKGVLGNEWQLPEASSPRFARSKHPVLRASGEDQFVRPSDEAKGDFVNASL